MSPSVAHSVTLERRDALVLRDVLTLAGRYLTNPYRDRSLAAAIGRHAADAAALLARRLMEEDH